MQLQNANKAVCLTKMLSFSEESENQTKTNQVPDEVIQAG